MKKIINLALSGGGFYGYAIPGALKELEKYSIFDFKNIIGSSIGSLFAGAYCVGYTADEMEKLMYDIDFNKLIKDTSLITPNLITKYGIHEAKKLEEYVEEKLRLKTNIKDCTFSQIEKNLTVVITNINYQEPRYCNRYTTPNMSIAKAIRISMGYPFIMIPILYEGDLYGDGGESLNYPINYYKNLDETIGIKITRDNENHDGTLNKRIPINNVFDYIQSIIMTLLRTNNIYQITDEHINRSIIVKINDDIEQMDFNLTLEQKKYIYQQGIKSTQEQIDKFFIYKSKL